MTDAGAGRADSQPQPPLLRVVRGQPDELDLAVLTAVLIVRAASAAARPDRESLDVRADRGAGHRSAQPVGPGAWVASGRVPGTRTRAAW